MLSKTLYRIFNWLFVIGVVTQVFLAGMVVVARQIGWDLHASLGHILGLPLILMLITMYTGKAGGDVKRTTWILFAVWVLQAEVLIFLRTSAFVPAVYLSAFHPVLALIDFWLGVKLLRQNGSAWQPSAKKA
jgi:hypothetical protein